MGPVIVSQNQANPESHYVASALVVTSDDTIAAMVVSALHKYAIAADVSPTRECARRVGRNRYELVVLEWETDATAREAVDLIRSAPSMRTAVLIVIAANRGQASQASGVGVHFVLQQPLSRAALDNVMRAAFGLIVRERRRYFRCPIDIGLIGHRRTEGAWQGRMANISEGGMCIYPPVALRPGESISVQFLLPSSSAEISVECDVQWADNEGRVGLQFGRISAQAKSDLQHWLTQQLDVMLRPTLNRLGYGKP